MSSPVKKGYGGDSSSLAGTQIKASSPINQMVPILNIPNPGGSSTSKSPDLSSSAQETTKNQGRSNEPEVMVLDDEEEGDHEVCL